MNVSDATKNEYRSSSVHKNLTIKFPELGLTIDNTKIYQESMKLKESILEKNNIEFVGCIASSFSVQIQGLKEDVKGKKSKHLSPRTEAPMNRYRCSMAL